VQIPRVVSTAAAGSKRFVTLNVGGHRFLTAAATLAAAPGSYFAKLAQQATAGRSTGASEFFVDRSGKVGTAAVPRRRHCVVLCMCSLPAHLPCRFTIPAAISPAAAAAATGAFSHVHTAVLLSPCIPPAFHLPADL
jgi:hypothetical protein